MLVLGLPYFLQENVSTGILTLLMNYSQHFSPVEKFLLYDLTLAITIMGADFACCNK